MWFMKDDGTFSRTNDPERVQLEAMFQELRLWKGENPMKANLGIDYFGVFENRVFLKSSVESITTKYAESFKSIEVSEPTTLNNEVLSVEIKVTMHDNSTLIRNLITEKV